MKYREIKKKELRYVIPLQRVGKAVATIMTVAGLFFVAQTAWASDFYSSGYGDADANGCYTPDGTYNGNTKYVNENGWVAIFPTNGNGWYLNDAVTEAYAMYYEPTVYTNPWQGTFQVSSGISPAGTNVENACPPPPTPPPTQNDVSEACVVTVYTPDPVTRGSYYLTTTQGATSTDYTSGLLIASNITATTTFDLDDYISETGLLLFRLYEQSPSPYPYIGDWGSVYRNGTNNCTSYADIYDGDVGTRIIDVSPDQQTASTTSEIVVSVYIDPDDFSSGTDMVVSFAYNSSSCTGIFECSGSFSWVATSTGYLSFSTTTEFASQGIYSTRTSIGFASNVLSYFGSSSGLISRELDSYTSFFTVGALSVLDTFSTTTFNDLIRLGALSTTTSVSWDTCIPYTSFSPLDCIGLLLVPPTGQMSLAIEQFKNEFLRLYPWGYATRLYDIVSGNIASTTLPVLSFTFPSSFPAGIAGKSFDFSPWDHLLGQGSILSTATSTDGTPFLSNFMIWWNRIVWFLAGMGILLELIRFGSSYVPESESTTEVETFEPKGTKRYRNGVVVNRRGHRTYKRNRLF